MPKSTQLKQIRISRAAPHTGRPEPLLRVAFAKAVIVNGKELFSTPQTPVSVADLSLATLDTAIADKGLPARSDKQEDVLTAEPVIEVPTWGQGDFDANGMRTVLDQVEVNQNGLIEFRLAREVRDDETGEIEWEWHRGSCQPVDDMAAKLAGINNHLAQDGWPPIDSGDVAALENYAAQFHSEDVKSRFADKQAAGLETAFGQRSK